jgi:hypothetical protein
MLPASMPNACDFKVADTVFAEAKSKDYSPDQWEAALARQSNERSLMRGL